MQMITAIVLFFLSSSSSFNLSTTAQNKNSVQESASVWGWIEVEKQFKSEFNGPIKGMTLRLIPECHVLESSSGVAKLHPTLSLEH
jgi:hypothetical protein